MSVVAHWIFGHRVALTFPQSKEDMVISFITVWMVSAILAGLILLFDEERKAQRKKTGTSFARLYADAVKREYGPQRKSELS